MKTTIKIKKMRLGDTIAFAFGGKKIVTVFKGIGGKNQDADGNAFFITAFASDNVRLESEFVTCISPEDASTQIKRILTGS